jgi:hypothetical protein
MDIFHNVKKYFSFTAKEMQQLAVSTLVLGFMFSFQEWGVESFNLTYGVFSLFNASLVVLVALLVHIMAQKIYAVYKGYKAVYHWNTKALAIGLLIAFVSDGTLLIAVPGAVIVQLVERFRVGKRWGGSQKRDEAAICFVGPFANIILALIFKSLVSSGFTNPLMEKLVLVSTMIAIFSILPIPTLEGFTIFYHSRSWGIFSILFIIGVSTLMYTMGFWQALFTALIVSAVAAIIYFIRREL